MTAEATFTAAGPARSCTGARSTFRARSWMLVLALTALTAVAQKAVAQKAVAAAGKPPATAMGSLRVSALVDRPSTVPGEALRLRVVATNMGEEPLSEIELEALATSGFSPCPERSPGGGSSEPDSGPNFEPDSGQRSLAAGASVQVFERRLCAGRSLGIYVLSATVSWREHGQRHQAFARSRDLTITSRWSAERRPVLNLLLLPLVLALVPALFAWWLSNLLRRRSERNEVLKTILPRFQVFCEQHYMPFSGLLQRFLSDYRAYKVQKEPSEARKKTSELFVDLMILLARDYRITRDVGAWYLQDLRGESLLDGLWEIFRREAEKRLTRTALFRTLIEMGEETRHIVLWDRFEAAFETAGSESASSVPAPALPASADALTRWHAMKRRFLTWLEEDSFGLCVDCLKLFQAVLHLEANRLYKSIYDIKGRFPCLALRDSVGGLGRTWRCVEGKVKPAGATSGDQTPTPAKSLRDLHSEMEEYVQDLERPRRTRLWRALEHLASEREKDLSRYARQLETHAGPLLTWVLQRI